jgi:uncharacterized protein (DUF486 family)
VLCFVADIVGVLFIDYLAQVGAARTGKTVLNVLARP